MAAFQLTRSLKHLASAAGNREGKTVSNETAVDYLIEFKIFWLTEHQDPVTQVQIKMRLCQA